MTYCSLHQKLSQKSNFDAGCSIIKMIWFILFILLSHQIQSEVYKISDENCLNLESVSKKDNHKNFPDSLVIEPDIYSFGDISYPCEDEGLYLHVLPLLKNSQRIVYKGDILKLLQSISWIHVHGYQHNQLSFQKALDVAKTGKLHMICGSISRFTVKLLNSLGVPCRFILFLTLDEWNNYDNGHSLVEVFENDQWVLYDIDMRSYFTSNGKKLNAKEFVNAVKENNYKRHVFSKSPNFAFGDLEYQKYDFSSWCEVTFLFENSLREWYRRVAQVPCIIENNVIYFTCDQQHRERIESYPYTKIDSYMDDDTFQSTFYQ